jgi:poly(3-hydroxybutyrate) depolymerase
MVNIQTWAKLDNCTGSAATDPNNALCQTYGSCSGNTQVTLCTVPEAGHLSAYSNPAAKVTDTAWNVFKTQSLP